MDRVPLTMRMRAVVAAAMLAGFYLVALVLLGCLIWLTLQAWSAFGGGIAHDLTYAAFGLVIALAVPTWQIFRAKEEAPAGVRLAEEQAPALWQLVREVAASVGTRVPDEIRLIPDVNAAAWESAGRVGLRTGPRYLYLGLPLLGAMTVTQVRSVVAHELGHFGSRHIAFGAVAYRGGQSIVATIKRVGRRRTAGMLLSAYAGLYFFVALALMRRMETEADVTAVRIAGADATREALESMPHLETTWAAAIDQSIQIARYRRLAPADLMDLFEITATARTPTDTKPASGISSRWNSHPPLAGRLRSIRSEDPPRLDLPTDTRPAIGLIIDPEVASAVLETAEFTTTLEVAAHRLARHDAEALFEAAVQTAGAKRRGLGSVLDILEAGNAVALTQALPRAASPETDLLIDGMIAAASSDLVAVGHASWTFTWTESLTLRSADDEPIVLRPLIVAACLDAGEVGHLRTALRDYGLDESTTVKWAVPGLAALDAGPVAGTLRPSEPLVPLLPDQLQLLNDFYCGRSRPNTDVLHAGLAAATIAELRIRDRIKLSQGRLAIVEICDSRSTGDRFLDSVLARIAAGGEHPVYKWLQMLGADVAAAVADRTSHLGRQWGYNDAGHYVLKSTPYRDELAGSARQEIADAMRVGEHDGPPVLLGMLLWGTELLKPVLGRNQIIPRFWLGRFAARDPLMVAIRTVIGLYMPLPSGGTGVGYQ